MLLFTRVLTMMMSSNLPHMCTHTAPRAQHLLLVCVAVLCALLGGCWHGAWGPGIDNQGSVQPWPAQDAVPWVVGAQQARSLVRAGATVLDVRDAGQRAQRPLPGARGVSWQQFSKQPGPSHGQLLDSEALRTQLEEVGVRSQFPVVVVGDPVGGWGEDGRIVWMLRSQGHERAALVDGGAAALLPTLDDQDTSSMHQGGGELELEVDSAWSATTEQVRDALGTQAILIDTRERIEFEGQTPYGETRPGHLDGAVHIHYKEMMDAQGFLLEPEPLRALLSARGIDLERPLIAYCTGGIRSGWFVAVLTWLGARDVRNYAGSMWLWSSLPADDYPLVVP